MHDVIEMIAVVGERSKADQRNPRTVELAGNHALLLSVGGAAPVVVVVEVGPLVDPVVKGSDGLLFR